MHANTPVRLDIDPISETPAERAARHQGLIEELDRLEAILVRAYGDRVLRQAGPPPASDQ